jgi:DNA-binding transcriptional LysR family regulator
VRIGKVFTKSHFLFATIHSMDTKNIDLNLLLALEALLSERNVTRAAARLHLSQPAMSARLSRLRDVFKDDLFIPSQRGMIATARALELESSLRQGLDALRVIVTSRSKFEPETCSMVVSIAASDYVQYVALIPFVLKLRRIAPGIRIAFKPMDGGAIDSQMAKGDVDLALFSADGIQHTLRSQALFDENYLCIARSKHPKIGSKMTLKRFCQLEHVVVSPRGGGFSGPTDEALAIEGLQRNVVLSAAHFLFVLEIVAQSDLIALIPSLMVRKHRGVRAFELPLPVQGFRIDLFWHDRTHTHPGHQWLRESLIDSLQSATARLANSSGCGPAPVRTSNE